MSHGKSDMQCRYFLHGACSKGSLCSYAHDLAAKADNVCKFYLAGSCMYGKACRYDHVKSPAAKIMKPVIDTYPETSHNSLIPLGRSRDETKIELESKEFEWYDAAEFVPGKKCHTTSTSSKEEEINQSGCLYSDVASTNIAPEEAIEYEENGMTYDGNSNKILCPFAALRDCPYGDSCEYLHGDICDMCGCQCLHPTNEEQRKEHQRECVAHHEREMELAFAVQKSSGVSCSICLDVVKDKANISERVFGVLENCNHPFCLKCIRKWRLSSHMEKTVIRACPICRVISYFVTPSNFWVEDETEKAKVINNYKNYLSDKPCRNFDQGNGTCLFGASCFYKHVLKDGTIDDSKPNIRHMEDSDGQSSVIRTARLDQFIAARDT